jgi:hypothetical protein
MMAWAGFVCRALVHVEAAFLAQRRWKDSEGHCAIHARPARTERPPHRLVETQLNRKRTDAYPLFFSAASSKARAL